MRLYSKGESRPADVFDRAVCCALIYKIGFIVVCCIGMVCPAQADWCHPIVITARILASPNPNDLHRNWRGENFVGLAWALAPGRRIVADGTPYIKGSLYSPRGGLVEKDVYVLFKEWSCD